VALSSFVLGFFLVSVQPTGTQYASEIALPTPEGTSNGLISLAGQVSVVLVYLMEPIAKATGSYTLPLLLFAGLLVLSLALAWKLEEPGAFRAKRAAGGAASSGGKAGPVDTAGAAGQN
jgi:MFS-type transporter involved in bile tolerance (Atg22 family)